MTTNAEAYEDSIALAAHEATDEHLDFHLGIALRMALELGDVEAAEPLLTALRARLEKLVGSDPVQREGASRLLADHEEALRAAKDRRRVGHGG
jgi:hypothetical protein